MPLYRYWPRAAGLAGSKLTTSTALAALMAKTGYATRALHEQSGTYTTQEQVTPRTKVIVGHLAQSEPVRCTERGPFYQELVPPDLIRDGSLTLVQRNGSGESVEPSSQTLAITTAMKRRVNSAMPLLANALEYITPGVDYVLVEMGEAGTGRTELVNDSKPGRQWRFTADMIADCVRDFKRLPDRIAEFWYANDRSMENRWLKVFAPLYYGQLENGTAFDLHNVNPDLATDTTPGLPSVVFDHCFWDFEEADPTQVGRGLFSRNIPLDISPHAPWSSDIISYLGVERFTRDERFVELGGVFGPPASMWQTDDGNHPGTKHWAGQGEAAYGFFLWPMLRAAGLQINAPVLGNLTVAPGGAYAEVSLAQGNGGVLSTKALVHGIQPDQRWIDAAPEYQEVMGFAILRAGDPPSQGYFICRPGVNSEIDAKYLGTVTIVGGKIRFTMQVPLRKGDFIYPLRTAELKYKTPGRYYRSDYGRYYFDTPQSMIRMFYPIEHVPAWFDSSQPWGVSGLEINQWQAGFLVQEDIPAAYFKTAGNGPYFRRTGNLPAGTTKIRHRIVWRVPNSASYVTSNSNSRWIFSQDTNGFDVGYISNTDKIELESIKDGSGTSVRGITTLGQVHRDVWTTMEFYADFNEGATGAFGCRFNGETGNLPWTKYPFSQRGNGAFTTNRPIRLHGVSSRPMNGGIEIASHRVWITAGGVESLWMEVEGDAATVNASTYKDPASGNAV